VVTTGGNLCFVLIFATEKPRGEKGRPSCRKATNQFKKEKDMELICRIVDQGALTTRQFVRNGQQQSITTMPFVLASGTDQFFCEMTNEEACACGPCDKNYYYKVSLSSRVSSFNTKDGGEGKVTRLYINKLSVL
jgi:hypothetical protein